MWRLFSKHKPKRKGWYVTTVEVKNQQRYTMCLYWYPDKQKFIDNIRANVCELYTVTGYSGERLFDIGQDRTKNVIAWRPISKPYMKGFIYKEHESD